jgi:hypothetical protein
MRELAGEPQLGVRGQHRRGHDEYSSTKHRADAVQSPLWRKNAFRGALFGSSGAWQEAVQRGGAPGSGAPPGNTNALKHGHFTRDAIAERHRYSRS